MGERAKIILNEYTAKSLLMKDTLDLDKFYTADLKMFIEVARKEIKKYREEIERLNEELKQAKEIALKEHKYASEMESKYITANNIINELEKWLNDNENLLIHYDYESKYDYIYVDNILNKLQELKGGGSNE